MTDAAHRIRIRNAEAADAPWIVEAQIRMAWETEELKLDRETVTKGVRAVLDDPSKGAYYIAERDGAEATSGAGSEAEANQSNPVGMLLTVPEWSDWRNGTVLWIHSVYVVPEARRLGVFRALYAYLRKKVETEPGYRGLRLYVEQKNTRAQAVYESLGMTKDHYYLYEWLKG